jgi:hypothetical protein
MKAGIQDLLILDPVELYVKIRKNRSEHVHIFYSLVVSGTGCIPPGARGFTKNPVEGRGPVFPDRARRPAG